MVPYRTKTLERPIRHSQKVNALYTVVLTEIGFDPERISNHCRGVTKRGR